MTELVVAAAARTWNVRDWTNIMFGELFSISQHVPVVSLSAQPAGIPVEGCVLSWTAVVGYPDDARQLRWVKNVSQYDIHVT